MLYLRALQRCTPRRLLLSRRPYTTPSSLSPNHTIYVSNSTNPYFNLTLEDWLFRHKDPKDPLLLLYRDSPCVIVGRNQNPWKEVNLAVSRQTGVPFIRRRSGGGTVYHDLGNTNFSIHLPRSSFDRHATARTVLAAVRSLSIDANVNDRNDICVGTEKVSGSAYKIVNSRAYHHGTMLISSRLDMLGELLRVRNKENMLTKGVASVRSPVCNLQRFSADVSHEAFVNAVIRSFRLDYDIDVDEEIHYVNEDDSVLSIEYIRLGMEELKTWDWAYGQTPEFTYTLERTFGWGTITADLHSKHGIILDCAFRLSGGAESWESEARRWSEWLKGRRYGFLKEDFDEWSLAEEGGAPSSSGERLHVEMKDWLVAELSE